MRGIHFAGGIPTREGEKKNGLLSHSRVLCLHVRRDLLMCWRVLPLDGPGKNDGSACSLSVLLLGEHSVVVSFFLTFVFIIKCK